MSRDTNSNAVASSYKHTFSVPDDVPSNYQFLYWKVYYSDEEHKLSANEIGRKLVDRIIPDFPCQISTHTNTEHTHNHIIFSAWDMDGKKYNDNIKAKNLIRKVSDELCNEYGLHVLEDTKEMKLIKYKDADGNLHYYEPTDRKPSPEFVSTHLVI